MSEFIAFIIGIFIGAIIGMLGTVLFIGAKKTKKSGRVYFIYMPDDD